jgi:myo-inositol-1-phosphate synthase
MRELASGRTGVWLIGARGSLAVTSIAGAAAVRAGLAEPIGLVGETPALASVGLPALTDLVFGGHDVVDTPLPKRAEQLVQSGVLPAALPSAVADDLRLAEAEIRQGAHRDDHSPQALTAERLAADLTSFRARHELDHVVVMNVSSTEPVVQSRPEHADLTALRAALRTDPDVLPISALYAYAAFTAGCPFIDFTPSTGARLPALHELALAEGLPYGGNDGKTGETLVKTALAPMFAARALRVLSWSGTNLLGGGDGATLADPAAAASKTASKQRSLAETLGHEVDGQTHIDYVPDLGDWKTAWDHVSFAGFLGVRMSLQFTWQGCDSALAAPLVLDLARLTARAHQAGEAGPLSALAFFFKDPIGTTEHRLSTQYDRLCAWAGNLA